MLRNHRFAVILVSVYLALYCIFFHAGYENIVSIMFMLSPVLVVWMVIAVLKHGKYTGPEFKKDEEWGYQDKGREEF
jgi:hypothetical protein